MVPVKRHALTHDGGDDTRPVALRTTDEPLMRYRRPVVTLLLFLLVLLLAPSPASADRRRPVRPPEPPETAEEWLARSAVPFATAEPRTGLEDLQPLRAMVGDARVVSLGEATHGSHEFFAMKHRILELLVEEMGFTVFAIEANLPEADVVDDYVQRGEGDAATALRGMYFWTWNTDEVLDLIEWMRQYNLRRGDRPAVHFRGFDAQYANLAVPRVRDFVARVDATRAGEVRELYRCIDQKTSLTYPSLSLKQQKACRESIGRAHALLEQNRGQYTAASSLEEYERHLRYARVIVQAEAIWTGGAGSLPRDDFMAENTIWLTDTVHAGEKVVLWAHNFHVAAHQPVAMGFLLRQHYGSAMFVVGFAFDGGTFNARSRPQSGPRPQTTPPSPPGGCEEFFATAGQPRFLLDLRRPPPVAARFLAQRRSIWFIGSVYDESLPTEFYRWAPPLDAAFDLLVYFETTTASRLR